MPIIPSFTAVGTSNPSDALVTDTSTGSDVAIIDRKIIFTQTDTTSLGASPYDFPVPGASITVSPLTQDAALTITMNWLDVDGSVLYTTSIIQTFNQYGLQFLEGLTQDQIADPSIRNDQNFMPNKFEVFTEIQSAINALTVGQSVSAAQSCILRYNAIIANQNKYF